MIRFIYFTLHIKSNCAFISYFILRENIYFCGSYPLSLLLKCARKNQICTIPATARSRIISANPQNSLSRFMAHIMTKRVFLTNTQTAAILISSNVKCLVCLSRAPTSKFELNSMTFQGLLKDFPTVFKD